MKSKITQINNKHGYSFNFFIGMILIVSIFGYIIYNLIKGNQYSTALKDNLAQTKAVIIDKRNYSGNSPVAQQFSYSYSFRVKGKEYTSDSRKPSLKIGDSIMVEYVPDNPKISQPVVK